MIHLGFPPYYSIFATQSPNALETYTHKIQQITKLLTESLPGMHLKGASILTP